MKKILLAMMAVICFVCFSSYKEVYALSANEEMKAVWITTVYNQDWPSKQSQNNVQAQKEEFINILEDIKAIGLNTVMVQVRPKGDALYKSNINPWSDVLTGTQGKDPGYDPLSFVVEEAHKRGIEVHAWLNPYRVTTSGTDLSKLADNHFAKQNPTTVLEYNNALVYNPGLPEVRQHIVDTVEEIVRNYNVDGIHFDDYFYPGSDVNDSWAYDNYGNGQELGDFRRNNVNLMVREVYNKVKSIKGNVTFGISPRGIWKNQSSDSTGSATNGAQSYYDIYADTRTWIKNGWLDYVVPQVYWEIGNRAADYSKLIPWWSNEVQGTNVKLYIGQGIYKTEVRNNISEQIALNRQHSNIKGSVYFSYRDIRNNSDGIRDRLVDIYNKKANADVENFLTSIYEIALGRTPDTDGFNYWLDRLVSRSCGGRWILINLLSEPEFKDLNLGAEDYVNKMYTVIVGREPDQEGFNYWVNMYNEYIYDRGVSVGSTRMAILSYMINEPEFKSRCINMGIDY